MSLSCLTCQNLPRVDSEKEYSERCSVDKRHFVLGWPQRDRNWSGNLAARPVEKMMRNNEAAAMGGGGKRVKSGRYRMHSSGPIGYGTGPRLVRSSGMRRDWSFEDLRQIMDEKMQEVKRH